MKRHWRIAGVKAISITLLVGAGMLLSACGSGGAVRNITKGNELANYSFSEAGTFEEGAYDEAVLRVVDGVYRVSVNTSDGTLWWGQWGDTHTDTVIDVDVRQTSERNENAYGVMCRVRGTLGQRGSVDPDLAAIMTEATPDAESTAEATSEALAEATAEATAQATAQATADNAEPTLVSTVAALEVTPEAGAGEMESAYEGDGYLFLIQGSGSYGIFRARGRDVVPLVDWQTSDKINVGPGENHLRAICAGDYLALYVNDSLVAEATDDTYRDGQVGLVASSANRLGVIIDFDNLQVSAAQQ